MELGTLYSLPDGDASALKGGEDIFSHQAKTEYENGLMGSRTIYNVGAGYRVDGSGPTNPGPGRGDAGPKSQDVC